MLKIYEVMDFADTAYIMHEGKLTFEISPQDKYHLEGKEIIFGSEEPLIAYKSNADEYFRFQTVYTEDESSVDKIPLKNLYKVISMYNIGFSITKNIAKFMHNEYEKQAKIVGWKTQESCQVEFNDLPETNKKVMYAVAQAIHKLCEEKNEARV